MRELGRGVYVRSILGRFLHWLIFRGVCVVLALLAWANVALCGPIHDAAFDGDLARVRVLLKRNPALAKSKDAAGSTPLHYAAREDHTAVAALLLEYGADVNALDGEGATPLLEAMLDGKMDLVGLLLSKGADTNVRDSNGHTPLHYAAHSGQMDVAEILLAHGADINAINTADGWTPLHEAAGSCHIDMAEWLLAHGADVNAHVALRFGGDGGTPLHQAAHCSPEMVMFLLTKGAAVNVQGPDGQTPLFFALNRTDTTQLLLSKGADVNAMDKVGMTPLCKAAAAGNKKLVELLLAYGADVNPGSYYEPLNGVLSGRYIMYTWSPLRLALNGPHQDVAELLRQHGGHE